jgi:uncharacterized caspase-like protein
MRVLGLVALVGISLVILGRPALADKRVALVIGNSAYQHITGLDNPKNDARLMAETLRGLGFSLIGDGAQIDLDKSQFDSVVQAFGKQLSGADVALFYYAGHGLQLSGSNYLVPVSANPIKQTDVDFQMVDAALVLLAMEQSGTKLNFVILDACHNTPFDDQQLRVSKDGLARMRPTKATLISYAAQPDKVAQDGADGDGRYAKALAESFKRPGIGIFQLFNEVTLNVMHSTGGVQQPWLSISPIDGNFYFVAPPVSSPPPVPQESTK